MTESTTAAEDETDDADRTGWTRSFLVGLILLQYLAGGITCLAIGIDGGSPEVFWWLVILLPGSFVCAFGAMVALAPHGDGFGGLILGVALGPIGLAFALSRARQLAKRRADHDKLYPEEDPDPAGD